MNIYKFSGGCHCGNISFVMEITGEPSSYNPRVCDCEFCTKHGASYISDKDGKLTISITNSSNLSRYKQGSEIADFLLCRECGVLVGVCYEKQGQIYVSVNSKAINSNTEFGEEVVVSPKQLTGNEKIQRWQDIWFSDIKVKYVNVS